jgi:hypothetical protein
VANQTFVNIGATGNSSGLTVAYNPITSAGASNGVAVAINNTNVTTYYPVSASNWVHYAATFANSTLNFFVNGTLVSTQATASSTFAAGGAKMRMGNDLLLGSPLNGSVNDVRVYSRALNSTEIAQLCANNPANLQATSNVVTVSAPLVVSAPYTTSIGSSNLGAIPTLGTQGSNLAVWLPFEGTLADATGGLNANLTWAGQPTYVQGPTGVGSKAIYLNNPAGGTVINYLTCTSSALSANTLTLTGWVYFPSVSALQIFWSLTGGGTMRVYITSSGFIHNEGAGLTSSVALSANKWYYITTTNSSSGGSIYINGVLSGVNTTGFTGGNTVLYIGCNIVSTQCFNGYISDFRIYNSVLSASDIQTLYATGANNSLSGCVSYFPFDGNLNDAMGANSVVVGAGSVSYVQGRVASSTGGVGSGKAVYLANEANVALVNAASNYMTANMTFSTVMTISMWIYATAFVNSQSYVFYTNGAGFVGFGLGFSSVIGGTINGVGWTTTTPAKINTWYHCTLVATTGTPGSLLLYVNGAYIGSLSGNFTVASNTSILFGNVLTGGTNPFAGYIDDFRIYNRALSASEVSGIYNASIANSLIAQYPFEANLTDSTGNGYNLSTSGTTGNVSYSNVARVGTYSAALINPMSSTVKAANQLTANVSILSSNLGATITAWINPATIPTAGQQSAIWSLGNNVTNTEAFTMYINSAAQLVVATSNLQGTSYTTAGTAATAVVPNKWYHTAAVYDPSGSNFLYVNGGDYNGAFNAWVPSYSNIRPNNVLTIGDSTMTNWVRPYAGLIDDIQVYNRPLKSAEVQAIYRQMNNITTNDYYNQLSHFPFDNSVADIKGTAVNTSAPNVVYSTSSKVGSTCLNLSANPWGGTGTTYSAYSTVAYPTISSTYSVWVNPSAYTGSGQGMVLSTSLSTVCGLELVLSGTGAANTFGVMAQINSGTWTFVPTSTVASQPTVGSGVWSHIAVTITTNSVILYVNGVAATPVSSFSFSQTATTIYVGSRGTWTGPGSGAFSGLIDDLRIYNRVLSSTEILSLYTNSAIVYTTSDPSLVQNFPFDGSLTNSVSGGLSLSSTGTISYVTTAKVGTNSVYLANGGATGAAASYLTAAYTWPTTFTISVWLYATAGGNAPIAFCTNHSTNAAGFFFIQFSPGGTQTLTGVSVGQNNVALTPTVTGITYANNTWVHVVITANSATNYMNVYFNGAMTNGPYTTGTQVHTGIRLGDMAVTTESFTGYVDDLRIYNRILNQSEITALSTMTPPVNYPLYNTLQPIAATPVVHYPLVKDYNDYASIGSSGTTSTGTMQYVPGVNGGRALYLANEANVVAGTASANTLSLTYTFPAMWSMSMWVCCTKMPSGASYILQSQSPASGTIRVIVGTAHFYFAVINAPDSTVFPMVANNWYHLAAVYTSTTATYYVNGTMLSSVVGTIAPGTGILFGNYTISSTSTGFAGSIDDFRLYNRVLTASDVSAIYQASAAPLPSSTVALPTTYGASNLVAGLTTWYKHDNNAGLDSTYNSNILTLTGTTYSSAIAKSATYSLGFGANVAGSTATATADRASYSNLPLRNFTVSTWVYPTVNAASGSQVFLNAGATNNPYGFQLALTTANVLQASIATSVNTFTTVAAPVATALSTSNWYHVAATQSHTSYASNASLTLYVNGAPVGSNLALAQPIITLAPNVSALRLGADLTTAKTNAFSGYLDDTRVYNRALAASDIYNLYSLYANGTTTPTQTSAVNDPTGALVSYLPFDGNVLDIMSAGSSNSTITYGNTPIVTSVLTSNIRFVSDTMVGKSSIFIGSGAPLTTGSAQQTHVDVTLPTVTGPMTVTNWFMLPSIGRVGTSPTVFNIGSSAYSSNGVALQVYQGPAGNSNVLTLAAASTNQINRVIPQNPITKSTATTIVPGTWYHSAVTFDSSNVALYLNGNTTPLFQGSLSSNVPSSIASMTVNPRVRFGDILSTTNTTGAYNGYVSDWRLYNRVLTITEITSIYQAPNMTINNTNTSSNAVLGWWKFDGSLVDTSANAWVSTITGGAVYVPGKSSVLALNLGNVPGSFATNYVDIAVSVAGPAAAQTVTACSLSFWVKPTSFTDVAGVVNGKPSYIICLSGATGASLGRALDVSLTSSGVPQLTYVDMNTITSTIASVSATPLTPGAWAYMVVTWTGNTIAFYVNNVLIGTSSTPPLKVVNYSKIRVGEWLGNGYAYNGAIDDLRWYNHVLTTAEIGAIYSNNYVNAANQTTAITVKGNLVFDQTAIANGRLWQIGASGVNSAAGTGSLEIYDATAAAPRVTVASTGYVGVGTTNPQNALHVSGPTTTSAVQAYPPTPLTGYSTTIASSYGAGTYNVSASSEVNSVALAYYAFDNSTSSLWQPVSNYSVTGTYNYTGTVRTIDSTGVYYFGEWIQLQMPTAIALSSYQFQCNNSIQGPGTYYILGSNDGIVWVILETRTGISWSTVTQTFTVSSPSSTGYTYIRLVINQISGSYGSPDILNIVFYGTQTVTTSAALVSDGRVGIGSTSPIESLDVVGFIDSTMGNVNTVSAAPHVYFDGSARNRDIFLKWMQRVTSTLASSWWSRANTPTYTAISGAPGSAAFVGGVLLPDGRVFMVPQNSTNFGLFNPTTNTYTAVAGAPGSTAFFGGVLLPDGRVFMVPQSSTNFGFFNPTTNTYSTVAGAPGGGAFAGGVLLPDGRVFMVPSSSTNFGLFNPITNTYTTVAGAPGSGAFSGGVLLPDGRVFMVPNGSTYFGLFNPTTNTYTAVAGAPGASSFMGGVLLPDGRVFMVPFLGIEFGLFDPITNTYSTIAGAPGAYAFYGGVLLPDGRVFLVPRNSTNFGLFNPTNNTFSTFAGAPGSAAFAGGVLLPDGRVFMVPRDSANFGIMSGFPRPPPELCYHPCFNKF